jgi:hypothetical protein
VPVEDRLEEYILFAEFRFSSLTHCNADFTPHVGDENNILEGAFAAKLSKHTEIASGNATHPEVTDAMHVNHPREPYSVFVTVIMVKD